LSPSAITPPEPQNAAEIGALYGIASQACRTSIEALLACGKALAGIKTSLPHGQWLLWIKNHQLELGFHDRTAQRLIAAARKYANTSLTSDLSEVSGLHASIWGNELQELEASKLSPTRLESFAAWIATHKPQEVGYTGDLAQVRSQIQAVRRWLDEFESLTFTQGRSLARPNGTHKSI
jgi:hypothetical protein